MGKRGNERRKQDKKLLRELKTRGYRYREYERGSDGELVKPKISKAEHRRRQVDSMTRQWWIEKEIVDAVCKRARDDIYAIEDAKFLESLEVANV